MTRPSVRVVSLVAVVTAMVFLVVGWLAYPFVFGDTPFVLDGSNAFLTCLHHHQYNACGYTGRLNFWGLMSPIGDWPLLQHVPDLLAIGLGASAHATRTRVLEVLNVVAVVAAIAVARIVFSRIGRPALFWAFVLVVISGPILWYARTTSGEVLAAGLLVCFVGAAGLPAHPVLVGLAACAASLTKETSYPFVVVMGVLGLVLARRRTGKPIRAQIITGAVGIAVAIVAASLFNVVRFGSVWNTNYLDSQLRTPGLGRKLEYALAVLVAPNGGILEFWPVATLLLVAACAVPFVARRRVDVRPAVVLAAVTLALAVGFGSWWTPFGWGGYGPRLMVPWLPPVVFLALVAYAEELSGWLRRLLQPAWRAAVVAVAIVLFTLPAVGQLWRPDSIVGFFAQENPPCNAPWRGNSAAWYACQSRQMWGEKPLSFYALHGLRSSAGLVTSFVVALGIAGCLVLLREELGLERRGARTRRKTRTPVRPAAQSADLQTGPAR